ncbi:pyridoxamine 5'-phosphate oxidase family protein [Gandjariella thermophila]|uniref:pyridoxamine 5'-phosphate oxidase family protein n=1 Tax=Gandjariella thermophila TaxID=1931992 RepID=UPI001CEF69A1|nr:pyridoxamine 5'-phosphate oxidase family protein [Gandjariella thermophila]
MRFEVLDRGECLRLLGSVPIGRVVFSEHALPAAQPVGFALFDGAVVFRTATDSGLSAGVRGTVVAFEADEFDPVVGSGWSVLVVGTASEVRDPEQLRLISGLPLRCWVPGRQEHVIRVSIDRVTGRRVECVPQNHLPHACHPSPG